MYEQDIIKPTILSVFESLIRLEVRNSFQLISSIVYIHTHLCTRRGVLNFQSVSLSQRLSVNAMNRLIDSILEITINQPQPISETEEPYPEPPDTEIVEPELYSGLSEDINQTILIGDTDVETETETDSEDFQPPHGHNARVLQTIHQGVYHVNN